MTLDKLGYHFDASEIQLDRIKLEWLELDSIVNLNFTNSYVHVLLCDNCTVAFRNSYASNIEAVMP